MPKEAVISQVSATTSQVSATTTTKKKVASQKSTKTKSKKSKEPPEQGPDERAQWVTQIGLNQKTVSILMEQDLDSVQALKAFAALAEPEEWKALGLTLGQEKLLRLGLKGLSTEGDMAESDITQPQVFQVGAANPGLVNQVQDSVGASSQPQQLVNAGKTFDALCGNSSGHEAPTSLNLSSNVPIGLGCPIPANNIGSDPRVMLTMKAVKRNTIHITQFLSEKTKKKCLARSKRDMVISTNEAEQVVLRSEESHPYKGLTVGEWGAANMRLLNHLLSENILDRSQIEFYMAYTAQVMDHLDVYEWESILEWDYQYRELQVEYSLTWGTQIPQLDNKILVPRQKDGRNKVTSWGSQKAARRPVCRTFSATGQCSFGDKCRFFHSKQSKGNQQQPPKNG